MNDVLRSDIQHLVPKFGRRQLVKKSRQPPRDLSRRAALRNDNAPVCRPGFEARSGQPLKIRAIVCDEDPLALSGKSQLCFICLTEHFLVARRRDIEAMSSDDVGDNHTYIFVEVQSGKQTTWIHRLQSTHAFVDIFVRHSVAFNIRVDFLLMIAVVAESVEYLRERQVGQMRRNFFGCQSQPPILDDSPYRCPRPLDDGLPTEDIFIAHDIAIRGLLHHGR